MQPLADRYLQERRVWDLAWRLLGHGARTRLIARWSGLSERRVRGLLRRFGPANQEVQVKRPRGKSPYKMDLLVRSRRKRSEAIQFAGLAVELHLLDLTSHPAPVFVLPNVDLGEAACAAFERFKGQSPHSALTIEEALLLIGALTTQREYSLGSCPRCMGTMLKERVNLRRRWCERCATEARAETGERLEIEVSRIL